MPRSFSMFNSLRIVDAIWKRLVRISVCSRSAGFCRGFRGSHVKSRGPISHRRIGFGNLVSICSLMHGHFLFVELNWGFRWPAWVFCSVCVWYIVVWYIVEVAFWWRG